MTHSLTLELPEKVYQSLAEKASKKGREIEEIAIEELSRPSGEDAPDPLDEFIGAYSSGLGDVGAEHDRYLGENHLSCTSNKSVSRSAAAADRIRHQH